MDAHEIGSHIGQYRLIKKIGVGGMGTVFVGEHILLGRRAAIKTLLPMLSVKPEIVDRFFKEARATSAIPDPGVVQIFDFGYHVDGTAYIVMELLEGESLSARLDRLGRLHPAEALRIVRQVAGALAAAHAGGIIHRDLKPENVFLIKDPELAGGERAKLIDFGICKLDDDSTLTESGVMLGTPVYMSPEQCQGLRSLDGRSDIYGLGCVLFQTLTGRVPFDHHGHGDLIVAHLQHDPPRPSELAPELPELVDEIVLRCLAKDPDERFQSMTALQHAIESVLQELTPVPASPGPTALALSTGFKSRYDGNLGSAVCTADDKITPNEKPTPKWFVTATPVPTDDDDITVPRTPTRSLFAILVSAAIVATAGLGLWRWSEDDANEASELVAIGLAAAARPPELAPAGTAMTVRETAREPAPPPEPPVAEVVESPPKPAATPAPKPTAKPVAKPAAKSAPVARRPVRPSPPPQPRPTPGSAEDLYDTR